MALARPGPTARISPGRSYPRRPARAKTPGHREPLEIRLLSGGTRHPVAVTMRTPGADFELAVGFLFNEGILRTREQLRRVATASSGMSPRNSATTSSTSSDRSGPADLAPSNGTSRSPAPAGFAARRPWRPFVAAVTNRSRPAPCSRPACCARAGEAAPRQGCSRRPVGCTLPASSVAGELVALRETWGATTP